MEYRPPLFDSLRFRLALLFALAVLIPSLFGIIIATRHYQNLLASNRAAIMRYGTLIAENERHFIQRSERLIRDLAAEPAITAASTGQDAEVCGALLAQAIKPYPVYSGAFVADLNGDQVCYPAGQPAVPNVAQFDWFKEAVKVRDLVLSGAVVDSLWGQRVFILAAPITDRDGRLQGVLALGLRLDWLEAQFSDAALPEGASLYILDQGGKTMVEVTPADTPRQAALPQVADTDVIGSGQRHEFQALGHDGVSRFYALMPVKDYRLYVLLAMPLSILEQSLRSTLFSQVIILCVISIAGIGVALVGTRILITRWTERLNLLVRDISQGNLSPQTPLDNAPRELRMLGETLREMAGKIRDRDAALNEMIDQRQRMLRELHHRIKNNLQIVISFLSLYSRLPMSDRENAGISDLQLRVSALALAQRHLYEKEDMKSVALQPFIVALCNLLSSHLRKRGDIRLSAEAVKANLAIEKVVPLALVITEIVSSGAKSFSSDGAGEIRLNLTGQAAGEATLSILFAGGDSVPPLDHLERSGLGASLLHALARQLGGEIECPEGDPRSVSIRFLLDEAPHPAPGQEG